MKKEMPLHLPLETTPHQPLYLQICQRIRQSIVNGVLKAGDKVPSARTLAAELGLARGTVDMAYSVLIAEGFLESRAQAGTIVSKNLAGHTPIGLIEASDATHYSSKNESTAVLPLQMGLPALDAFPRKLWSRLGARTLRSMQAHDMAYPDDFGIPRLRSAIASYLQVSRGVECQPHQVFITTGYRNSLELIARAFFSRGDRICIEDPGFPPTREVLNNLHLENLPIAVDKDGICTCKLTDDAKAAIVTPSHQSPMCVSLSLPRRLELLQWAKRTGGLIIEDDYDGEFHYATKPLPALHSLDTNNCVIYSGTFSKVLFPALRLAYVVVPEEKVATFETAISLYQHGCQAFGQHLIADFMMEGHFIRHIHKMRKLYALRQQTLSLALNKILADKAHVLSVAGGMHLLLRLHDNHCDKTVAKHMFTEGLAAQALSNWAQIKPEFPALLLGFTNIADEAAAINLSIRIESILS